MQGQGCEEDNAVRSSMSEGARGSVHESGSRRGGGEKEKAQTGGPHAATHMCHVMRKRGQHAATHMCHVLRNRSC